MSDKLISLEQRKHLSLDILTSIDVFCKAHGIEYCLNYGTLIGAIRHKGFIPWDDDIDLLMTRENYNKFVGCFNRFNQEANLKCIAFETGDFYLPFAKIVNTDTHIVTREFIEIDDLGIGVDIFPFDYLSDSLEEAVRIKNDFARKRKYILYPIYKDIRALHGGNRHLAQEMIWRVFKAIGYKKMDKPAIRALKELPSEKKLYGSNMYFYEGSNVQVVESSILDEIVSAEFEGKMFPIPKRYDYYLTLLYGDYMELPPENERIAHLEDAYFVEK